MSAAIPALPSKSDSVGLRCQWWQRVLSALGASGGRQSQVLARCLCALRTLADGEPEPLCKVAKAEALQLAPATTLALWQGGIEDNETASEALQRCLNALEQTPEGLVRRYVAQQTLALLEWSRGSCQAPAATALPTLMHLCRQLHALLEVSEQSLCRVWLRQMEVVLLARYLRGQNWDAAALQQCCGFFWALHYGLPQAQTPQVPLDLCLPPIQAAPCFAAEPSPAVQALRGAWPPCGAVPACMGHALQRMQLALAPLAEPQAPPTGAVIRQGYELAVVALQLRATAAAILFGCLQALLIEHWARGLPLANNSRQRLQVLYAKTQLAPDSLCAALHALVALWPPVQQTADLQVPLAGDGGSSAGSVRLAAIPALLSRRLPTLNAAQQSWFAQREELASRQLALQGELMMLERGAAAFRVRGVERLCGRLLELLMLLDLQGALARFPGALLWRAHCHLLDLLDAAATWWEATPDQQLLEELHQCSRQLLPAPPANAVAEPTGAIAEPAAFCEDEAWHEVRRQLLGYVQSFSGLLEIQMRLEISGDGASWPVTGLWRLQAALMPLLRYLLLEFGLALEQRRALRLPTTGCLWLCLQHDAVDGLRALLRDDSAHQAPGAVQWQQLQHRVLKHAGATIQCEQTSLGRCFTLTLPLASTG